MNFFGVGNTTPGRRSTTRSERSTEDSTYTQNVVGVNFRGDLAKGFGAGPISSAFGAEFRQDEVRRDARPGEPALVHELLAELWRAIAAARSTSARYYGEIQVPFSKKVNTDFSLRANAPRGVQHRAEQQDSKSHDFDSWKAALTYDATSKVRLRATLSRDVRGAGFRELFLPRASRRRRTTGRLPERASTTRGTATRLEAYHSARHGRQPESEARGGGRRRPWRRVCSFERLRFSADWYKIDLNRRDSRARPRR